MLHQLQSARFRCGQRGFSIVELSIAMLIAIFLLGGLVTLVIGTRRTSSTQTAVNQLQDNERIAMTLITNIVQQAGYFPYPTAPENQSLSSFIAEAPLGGVTLPAAQALADQYNAAAPGDAFAVRFFVPQPDPNKTIIDCAGQSNIATSTNFSFTNVFLVAQDANGTWWLQCQTRTDNNGTLGTALTVNLIPNVTQISVLYGVGSSTAGDDNSVVQYLNAGQMNSTNWANVTALRITLTFLLPVYGTTGGQMTNCATTTPCSTTFTRVIPIMSRAGVDT
jgi:type IV pilus assembly protein PilW